MGTSQISQETKKLSNVSWQKNKQSKHTKQYWHLYNQKRLSYLLKKQQEYRFKKQSLKPFKSISSFQTKKARQLLKLLVNYRSFVPVPTKLKHPIIKDWNSDKYWYNKKIDFNNLERGCVRIIADNWKNCYIGWLDIDCKKWTKIAKKYGCGYVNSPKGHIRIPFLFRSKLNSDKTGALYYQGIKIGDAKISGEVMLPNNAYYDKQGNFLGYYRYKAWGTFFPLKNKIFANPNEFWTLLQQDFKIEYHKSRTQFIIPKVKEIPQESQISPQEQLLIIPMKEPPWQKLITTSNNISKIGNY
jgi:hypothetical protein